MNLEPLQMSANCWCRSRALMSDTQYWYPACHPIRYNLMNSLENRSPFSSDGIIRGEIIPRYCCLFIHRFPNLLFRIEFEYRANFVRDSFFDRLLHRIRDICTIFRTEYCLESILNVRTSKQY